MKRKIEFAFYAVMILYFIVRYANVDMDEPPRRPSENRPAPSIVLPEEAALPRDVAPRVTVNLDEKAQNSVGTAFNVSDDGLYITARHVTEGCENVYLVKRGRELQEVSVLDSVRSRDFAVLKSPEVISLFHTRLVTDAPVRGDVGYMMGFPQGEPADVKATAIGHTVMKSSGRYSMREPVIAWVERERRPGISGSLGGISGGPVFNPYGDVVGTVVAGSPRRGRVYTTHPRVFNEAGLTAISQQGVILPGELGPNEEWIEADSFDLTGNRLREHLTIAQVYCKVG